VAVLLPDSLHGGWNHPGLVGCNGAASNMQAL
jgi:hypothetical protein